MVVEAFKPQTPALRSGMMDLTMENMSVTKETSTMLMVVTNLAELSLDGIAPMVGPGPLTSAGIGAAMAEDCLMKNVMTTTSLFLTEMTLLWELTSL